MLEKGVLRETRGRWYLITVETEVNGDSKRTDERGPILLVRWACLAGTRDFYSAFATLVGQVQIIFFLTVYSFNSFVPTAHQATL
jgi:hypothetical protein